MHAHMADMCGTSSRLELCGNELKAVSGLCTKAGSPHELHQSESPSNTATSDFLLSPLLEPLNPHQKAPSGICHLRITGHPLNMPPLCSCLQTPTPVLVATASTTSIHQLASTSVISFQNNDPSAGNAYLSTSSLSSLEALALSTLPESVDPATFSNKSSIHHGAPGKKPAADIPAPSSLMVLSTQPTANSLAPMNPHFTDFSSDISLPVNVGDSMSVVSQFLEGSSTTASSAIGSLPVSILVQQLQQYGAHCMAQSTLQPGMLSFMQEGTDGYIAYAMLPGLPLTAIMLSDPVAPKARWSELTAAFLKNNPRSMAFQVSAEYASILSAAGLRINGLGGETELDVQSYSYSGNAKRSLRQTAEWAKRAGVTVREVTGNISADMAEVLRGVSASWASEGGISRVSSTNTWFVNRMPLYEAEPHGVRTFAAFHNNIIVGFAVFDPMYGEPAFKRTGNSADSGSCDIQNCSIGSSSTSDLGRSLTSNSADIDGRRLNVCGFYSNITRTTREAHKGTGGLLIQSALMVFRSEGVQVLSLGLSPLHNMTSLPGAKTNTMIRETFEWLYEHCNSFYPYQSLAHSKSKYGASLTPDGRSYNDPNVRWVPSFIATPRYHFIYPRYDLIRMGILSGLSPPLGAATASLIKSEIQRYKSGAATAQSKATAKMDSNGIKHLATVAAGKGTKQNYRTAAASADTTAMQVKSSRSVSQKVSSEANADQNEHVKQKHRRSHDNSNVNGKDSEISKPAIEKHADCGCFPVLRK